MFFAMALVAVQLLLVVAITRKSIISPVLVVKSQVEEISKGNLSSPFGLEANTSGH